MSDDQQTSGGMVGHTKDQMVSIITPVFNCEGHVKYTIESVQNQSYSNWEMIIVDDASTDGTVEIIREYAALDKRIRYSLLKENSGSAIARNVGLKMARSNYIAFLDSDDLWLPRKLDIQLGFMQKNNHPISFTSYELINHLGQSMNKVVRAVPQLSREEYLKTTLIGCSTALVDRNKTGEFEFLDIRTRQDTHLWITLLGRGFNAYGLEEVLTRYRVRSDSISSNKFKAAAQVWNLYHNIVGISFVRSAYYFSFYVFNAIKKRI